MIKFIKYFFFLFCFISKAGNDPVLKLARNDLKKTNEMYLSLKSYSMDTYYMVYGDHQTKSYMEAKNGKYFKYDKSVFTKIDDIETYAFGDKIISVNNDNKQITVGDNKAVDLHPLQTNIDSLLTLCEDIKMETLNSNARKYKLFFDDSTSPEFSQIDIDIDIITFRFLKITLYYASKMNLKQDFYAEQKEPRLEIIYKNLKPLDSDPSIFNDDLYILNVNGKLRPAPKYYNFKVSDIRNQTMISSKKTK